MTTAFRTHSVEVMRIDLAILALCLGLLVAPTAGAQEAPPAETSAEEHSRRGVEYYKEGKLPEAVREMLVLMAEGP